MATQASTGSTVPQTAGALPGAPVDALWRSLIRHPLGLVGVVGFAAMVLFSFVGPLIYRANPYTVAMAVNMQPPSLAHLLGTDNLGRDQVIRLMVGGQSSLIVGITAAASSTVIGVVYGAISGMLGGWVDVVLMRIVDVLRSIPALFLLIFFDSAFSPSAALLVFLIAIVSWHGPSRLVRAEVLSLKERPYVEASHSLGSSKLHILWYHILPNAIDVVVVSATFMVADAILLVAALSFLGLGIPPPAPNWGTMLSDSITYLAQDAWWLIYPPGLAILVVVISINFVGDALRESMDRRLLGRST
ncbi:MAG: ABC transporter permease [Candidatus Dormibacteraceae bacterium]